MLSKGEATVSTGRWLARDGSPRLVVVTALQLSDCAFPHGRDDETLDALYPEGRIYSVWTGASMDGLSMTSRHFGSLAEARGWVEARGWRALTWTP